MRPATVERIVDDAADLRGRLEALANEVAGTGAGAERAFRKEREAERELVLDLLQAVRPAFKWIADTDGKVQGLADDAIYRQVIIDTTTRDGATKGMAYQWRAFDHPDLGLAIAGVPAGGFPALVWPNSDLPFGREGGPRLGRVLVSLADRLASHAQGNASRRAQEAAAMAERLRAIQTLLRGP